MRRGVSRLVEHAMPALAGMGAPFLSAMTVIFSQEVGAALISSDSSLTKAVRLILTNRIEAAAQLAAPALNVLLTALLAYACAVRGRSRYSAFLTAAGSAAAYLTLGLLFGFSFAFWEGGMGFWYCLGLLLTLAAGVGGGALGRRNGDESRAVARILSDSRGDGVFEVIRGYARLVSVPAVYARVQGTAFFWSERRMEPHRAVLQESADRIAALLAGPASVFPGRPQPVSIRRLSPASRAPLQSCGIRCVSCIPLGGLAAQASDIVVLYFLRHRILLRHGSRFDKLSSQLALRIENARLLESARQSAVLEERQRLAREIHDTIAQDLIGIVVTLESLEQNGGVGAAEMIGECIREAVQTARRSLNETRRLVWALRPLPLEENPLPTALSRRLNEWSAQTGTEAGFQVEGEPRRLSPDTEITLFRMLQEACANAARHSRAEHLWVLLRFTPDLTVMSVRDDGIGMGDDRERVHGFGLQAMRQRIEALGGALTVRSTAGAGTELEASIPTAMPPAPEVTYG